MPSTTGCSANTATATQWWSTPAGTAAAGSIMTSRSCSAAKEYVRFTPRGRYIGSEPFSQWHKPSVMLVSEANYSDAHGSPYTYKTLEIRQACRCACPGNNDRRLVGDADRSLDHLRYSLRSLIPTQWQCSRKQTAEPRYHRLQRPCRRAIRQGRTAWRQR